MRRKRNDPRGEATRIALLETAEELFAEKGVENVTLRQIGEAIGSDNNAVITYYFGTKEKLLRSILEYRIKALETRRNELLQQADAAGLGHDTLTLFHTLFAPISEQRNANGKPSYAGLLSAAMHFGSELPIMLYPSPREIADRLRKSEKMSESVFTRRFRLVSLMVIDAIEGAFKAQRQEFKRGHFESVFADTLQMAAAAFAAPVGTAKSLRRLQVHKK